MTLIAGQRIVAVAANLIMIVVGSALLVTIKAVERGRAACGVTERTGNVVVSLERERVTERRRRPRRRVVTLFAVLWETQSDVIGSSWKVIGVT